MCSHLILQIVKIMNAIQPIRGQESLYKVNNMHYLYAMLPPSDKTGKILLKSVNWHGQVENVNTEIVQSRIREA